MFANGTSLYDQVVGTGKRNNSRVKADLQKVLAECEDFKNQPNILTETIQNRGHIAVFYPKFHCELSPIERFWCDHKKWIRSHCGMKFAHLRYAVQAAIDAICPDSVVCVSLTCF